jgi:signal transduction histidine kinase
MNGPSKLDFSNILTTSAHDMKNSIFMLLQSIEQLDLADNLTPKQHQAVADLHYQTSRINGSLMQLLSLYPEELMQVHIAEHSVSEMLQEALDRNRLYINSHHIQVDLQVEADLTACFDKELITYLVSEIFINALRHTDKSVKLRAYDNKETINIQVEDDGEGYPDHMLAISQHCNFNSSDGRSGIGVLFAQKIAAAHKKNQLQGNIILQNKGEFNGNLFTLSLPS